MERSVYAFGLLEALVKAELPFIFKGGTALMLLLNKPKRLSADIDIIVQPGTDVEKYITAASEIFPFRFRISCGNCKIARKLKICKKMAKLIFL